MKSQIVVAGRMVVGMALLVAFCVFYSSINLNAAGSGRVSGMVKLNGEPAKAKIIDMSKEPNCAKIHEGNPAKSESVVMGPDNALQNVVVYVSEGLKPADDVVPSEPREIKQLGCQYFPHVVALDVQQTLKVLNIDNNSHNIHPLPKLNAEWNKSQPPGAPPFEQKFGEVEIIPVKCNIHPWMHSYFAVVKGPYAISDDKGSYALNLSPGTYTLTAWHEVYGAQSRKVTIVAGKPATLDFTFKAK